MRRAHRRAVQVVKQGYGSVDVFTRLLNGGGNRARLRVRYGSIGGLLPRCGGGSGGGGDDGPVAVAVAVAVAMAVACCCSWQCPLYLANFCCNHHDILY